MYILVDGFTDTVHPLGKEPLEAILAFCDHIRKGGYPSGIRRGIIALFERHVRDGAESELFAMVDCLSEEIAEAKSGPKGMSNPAFRIRIVPRPPCRQCQHWKGHGVYCETGFTEQSAWAPVCSEWQPKEVHWADVDPTHPPTELYEHGLDKRIYWFLVNNRAPVSIEGIENEFSDFESVVVRAAVLHLFYNEDIEGVEKVDDRDIPTKFRARLGRYRV